MTKIKFLLLTFLITCAICLPNYFMLETVGAANEPCSYHEQAYQDLDLTNLSQELEGTGLMGSIHGAYASSRLFVLSVREPDNFFNHREFSLIPSDETSLKGLNGVKRQDEVCIKGRFIPNPSEQKHILVQSVTLVKPWQHQDNFDPYQREVSLPEDLINQSSFVGKVHAVYADGQVLVVEYKDGVIPVFVQSPQLTKDLFRGDIIRLSYQIQTLPTQPTHLRLNLEQSQPLEVLDSIVKWHEKDVSVRGKLVKFPQSPQIKFDVYAIAVDTEGITRYFTLVNFQDASTFQNIRDKLAGIWETHLSTAKSGRNMLINPEVTIEVQGVGNVVSPAQANPQILLSSEKNIQVIDN
ncbi:conserved hypothetical protein [Gloeothece citriformis PCC 7424]|uniref:Uncharacterized protein n=1 Tax=Gloeothece citriformis (strain PCC 7424) TaxID=65393 RepID=B7KDY5_GLOC7|nr:hypothetical protein [Gloeothece citriformis]ACK71683.1 conserved hypothetical protein [Gloeothece citriformis PCC 7424]